MMIFPGSIDESDFAEIVKMVSDDIVDIGKNHLRGERVTASIQMSVEIKFFFDFIIERVNPLVNTFQK